MADDPTGEALKGVSGALILANPYHPGSWYSSRLSTDTATQQDTQQWLSQQQLSNTAPPTWRQPTVTVMAAREKIRIQIARLIDALPMSVCSRITSVDFFPSFQEVPMKFTIVFDSGKSLDIFDVDNFPSDEHLAQIALDCP